MTDNEAIKEIKYWLNVYVGSRITPEMVQATGMAIKALEEVQQYQSIGTHEECKVAMQLYNEMLKRKFTLEAVEEYMKFEDELVGRGLTFGNLIDFMDKNTPKKPRFNGKDWYRCHNGCKVHTVGFRRDWYCPNCGQRICWEGVE